MKQFLVIGCGRFGSSCTKQLIDLGNEVIALDSNEEVIDKVSEYATHAVAVENINDEVLKSVGASNVDIAIIAISSNFEQAILSVVSCKNLGIKKIIVKARDRIHADVLKKIGADEVIIPEYESAIRLARSISSNQICDFIEFDENYSIVELMPLEDWVGKTLIELSLRVNYGINIIVIKNNDETIVNPPAEYIIRKEDLLTVAGKNEDLDKLTNNDIKKNKIIG